MKNLNSLFEECRMELKRINMDISDRIVKVEVNGRLRTVLGRCSYNYRTGNYSIEINPCLLADNVETQAAKETIIHELIHTCPGCMNHGYEWKRRGDRASRMLGYDVCRLRKTSDLEAWGVEVKRETFKYALVCEKCGYQWKYKRWGEKLANSSNFRHSVCGGSLKAISLDGSREVWAANRCK